jgi:hypothetical protein
MLENQAYEGYQWVYQVFMNEYVLFFQIVPFHQILDFPRFELPKGVLSHVQVRVILINDEGDYIDSSYDIVPPYSSHIKAVLNIAPIKMMEKFLASMA